MPRVLILCEFPTLLGSERSMLATMPHVERAGYDVAIAAPPWGPLRAEVGEHRATFVPFDVRDEHGDRRPLEEIRAELAQLIDQVQPDLVHANSLSMGRISGRVVAMTRVPSVVHIRDIVGLSRAAVGDVNRHRRIVAVSRETLRFHVAQGVDARRAMVLHNGVDIERFRPRWIHGPPATRVSKTSLPANATLITTVGQLGVRKGIDRFLAAAARVLADRPDVHFLIVGSRTSDKAEARTYEQQLRTTASGPPFAGQVHFLGTRGDVPEILSATTILLHAARQEPLGRVLLEASASGVAIVATDVGGTREIFPDACEAAILVPEDRDDARVAADLANAVLCVLNIPGLAERLGGNARRRAVACFASHRAARKTLHVYRDVLGMRRPFQADRAASRRTSVFPS